MKYIKLTTERAIYNLPLEFVAKHRAEYYCKNHDAVASEEINFIMEDDYEGIDWLKNNMNYEDFKEALIKIEDIEQEEDWCNCEADIIESK